MKLYRAVDDVELADIIAIGRFRCVGSTTGKYFSGNQANASWFGRQAYLQLAGRPFTIVQVQVHYAIEDTLCPIWSDGFWTWFIESDDLLTLMPDILNSVPIETDP